MRRHTRRKRGKLKLALLAIFVLGIIAFVAASVLTDRRRQAAVASIPLPPEAEFHTRVARAIEQSPEVPAEASDLQPALDAISRWRVLFEKKREAIDAEEWDGMLNLWFRADVWETSSSEEKARIVAFLDARRDFFDELRRVAALGGPIGAIPAYPARVDMEHLSQARGCARLLWLDAICRANTGETEAAVADGIAGLQLARALSSEPSMLAQLTRYACTGVAYGAIVHAFPPGRLSAGDTAALLGQAQLDPGREPLVVSMKSGERTYVYELNDLVENNWLGRYKKMHESFFFYHSRVRQRATALVYSSPLARPWLNEDIARLSEHGARITAVAGLPYYEAIQRYGDPERRFGPYTNHMASSYFGRLAIQAGHEAKTQLLQIGLTLELRQATEGRLPAILDALSAELPAETLVDPFMGRPFVYRPEGGHFVLYSLGRNLVDDGGRNHVTEGDLVWRDSLE